MEKYLLTAEFVADRDVNEDFVESCAIVQGDGKTIANGSFSRVVIVQSNLRILDTVHLVSESVDARVGGNIILVIFSCQSSKDQRNCDLPLAQP